jgi:hypothetical protein
VTEIMSEMDQAAAAYWFRVARAGGPEAAMALSNAQRLVVEARAEARLPGNTQAPTLNQQEAPPIRFAP